VEVASRPDVDQGAPRWPKISERVPLHSTTMMPLSELPSLLWAHYIEYLWDYEPGSWVYTSASTFRLFAAFIFTPLALLVMLASL